MRVRRECRRARALSWRVSWGGRIAVGAVWAVWIACVAPVLARGGEVEGALAAPVPMLEAPPEELAAEDLERYWSEAVAIELRALTREGGRDVDQLARDLDRAAHYFERVAESPSGEPSGHWRASRATWLAGEMLPMDARDAKMDRFSRAEMMADLGIEANPDCGECLLWKFIAMGRIRTTSGMLDAARSAREMADLLDRALELRPAHTDGENNSTMGNLHYSSAIFYRVVPDWFFIKWMLGVRGDKERALAHSRKALALHPNRLDYRVELGTQLLCIGSDKKDAARLVEGRRVMQAAIGEEPDTEDQRREVHFARVLLETPKKACGYTGDQIVEFDKDSAKNAKRRNSREQLRPGR